MFYVNNIQSKIGLILISNQSCLKQKRLSVQKHELWKCNNLHNGELHCCTPGLVPASCTVRETTPPPPSTRVMAVKHNCQNKSHCTRMSEHN